MPDLTAILASTGNALDVDQYGLSIVGQNVANVNTPGYTDRTVELAEVPPVGTSSPGGVEVEGVQAARAPLIQAQLTQEQPSASAEQAISTQLSAIQGALGAPGASLDQNLEQFYGAFATLAQNPTSVPDRQQVIAEGQQLTQAFGSLASQFTATEGNADTQVRGDISQVNQLSSQIASLNQAIATSGGGDTNTLQDQESVAVQSLSTLLDVSTIQRSDGGVDVTIGNGQALVSGSTAYSLAATSAGPSGFAQITLGDTNVTSQITGGDIGGQLKVRDVLVPGYMSDLDHLAYGVETDVNALHTSGYDLNGDAGENFFTPPSAIAGAASTMAVNPAIVSDPSLVVAAGSPSAGDNEVANAIAALQNATISDGTANPINTWGALVYQIGSDAQTASQEQTNAQDVVQQLQNLQNQVSGVSIDQEATNMMVFQQAYEANARFFNVVDQTIQTLMQMGSTI